MGPEVPPAVRSAAEALSHIELDARRRRLPHHPGTGPRARPADDTAVGTSLPIVSSNSTAGFAAHAGEVPMDIPVSVALTAAALAAGRLAIRVDTTLLRRWSAWLVFVVAARIAVQLAVGPLA